MPATPESRGPGAVRNERVRLAILKSASELLMSVGYEHLTIDGIARRAKVGKPTIYRWWNSKSELLAECLIEHALLPEAFIPRDSGDIIADISEWFDEVIRFAADETNTALVRSLIAAATDNPEIATQLIQRLGATPDSLTGRFRIGVDSGELKPGTPIDELTEMLLGLVIYRIVGGIGFRPGESAVFVPLLLSGSQTLR
ncbi:MAG: TetR/AcrR family transcriptional regulator [Actinomycetota bacterium]